MRVGEVITLLISTVTMIPTVIIFIILWKYHSTIPFNKRSTITYLSLLLICSITSLILISVCRYISLILLLLNLSGYSFDAFHFVCLTGVCFCSFSKNFVDSSFTVSFANNYSNHDSKAAHYS